VTGSAVAGRILGLPERPPNHITFTNVKFQTARGFLVQDAQDVVFDNVRIDAAVGAPLVLDNGFVKFDGSPNKRGPRRPGQGVLRGDLGGLRFFAPSR
jgi:hypothetical protein